MDPTTTSSSNFPDPVPSTEPAGQGLTDDRRLDTRHAFHGQLRMRVDSPHLKGQAENVSSTGILFFTDRPLRVTVEMEEDGVLTARAGRLVRAQRVNGDSTGWAVEFDEQD